jgi:serine/threonine protein kinase
MKESFTREIIKQIVEGLHYLHEERHVIHRDIKPPNIMINWKLANFQTSYNKLEDFQKALNL